jgi:serine phosphatase RsbU (regulator of sigma subunit)
MRIRSLLFILLASFLAKADPVTDSIRLILSSNLSDSAILSDLTLYGRSLKPKPAKLIEVLSELKNFSEKVKNRKDLASANRKIGVLYGEITNYDKAIEYTHKGIQISEEIGDKNGLAFCYNNIANFYQSKGKLTEDTICYNKALGFHFKQIELRKELKDTTWLYLAYNNASIAYINLHQYEKAIEILTLSQNFYKGKKIHESSMALVYSNLGDAYLGLAHRTGRREYLRKALSYYSDLTNNFYKEIGNHDDFAEILQKAGEVYYEMEQYDRSLETLNRAYEMFRMLHHNEGMSTSARRLAKLYERKGDHKTANHFYSLYMDHKDTVLNKLNKINIEQMQMLYQSSQKDREIDKLKTDTVLQNEKLSRQKAITLATFGGLALLVLTGVILLRGIHAKKKANLKLTLAYQNIEFKNHQITESINYAKRLQSAILPPEELMKENLNDFFIFYSPKDIVSGDFYGFTKHKGKIFFAIADCTGHGVPGALMSMIGNTLLQEIINQKNILDPGEILTQLNEGISTSLRQQNNSDILAQDDGMDISIICLDEKNRTSIQYGSANHSIFVKNNKGVEELKGDIYSIGGSLGNTNKKYNTFSYTAEAGSFFILSSDGFADQFGGNSNSKYLITKFEEFISGTDLKNSAGKKFEKEFNDWMGEHKQTDDVLVAGFSV